MLWPLATMPQLARMHAYSRPAQRWAGAQAAWPNWPRPFVFRAAHLDGRVIAPGEPFHFDVHLFDLHRSSLAYFVLAFAQLAREGLGPRRGRAELLEVEQLRLDGSTVMHLYNTASGRFNEHPLETTVLEWKAPVRPVSQVRIRFVTPTELKGGDVLAAVPEFPYLFGRLRDRLSTLRALYGNGPLEIDFRDLGERAKLITLASSDLQWIKSPAPVEPHRAGSSPGRLHRRGGVHRRPERVSALPRSWPVDWGRAPDGLGQGRDSRFAVMRRSYSTSSASTSTKQSVAFGFC